MSSSYEEFDRAIIIASDDDEEQDNSPNLNTAVVTEEPKNEISNRSQHQNVSYVEYFHPSQKGSTSEVQNISTEHILTFQKSSNCIETNSAPHSIAEQRAKLYSQGLAANSDEENICFNKTPKQNKLTKLALRRLAKDLQEIVLVSLGNKNSRREKLTNVEKIILEVSKAEFDISNHVLPKHSTKLPSYNSLRNNNQFVKRKNAAQYQKMNENEIFGQKNFSNGSGMGSFEMSNSPFKSGVIRLNDDLNQVKNKRGRSLGCKKRKKLKSETITIKQSDLTCIKKKCGTPLGGKKSKTLSFQNAASAEINLKSPIKNNNLPLSIFDSKKRNPDKKNTTAIYKNTTVSLAATLGSKNTELDADINNSQRKVQASNLEINKVSFLKHIELTEANLGSKKEVIDQQNIYPIANIEKASSITSDVSPKSDNLMNHQNIFQKTQ